MFYYDITYNNGETISRSRVSYNRVAAAVELELSETMEVQTVTSTFNMIKKIYNIIESS